MEKRFVKILNVTSLRLWLCMRDGTKLVMSQTVSNKKSNKKRKNISQYLSSLKLSKISD